MPEQPPTQTRAVVTEYVTELVGRPVDPAEPLISTRVVESIAAVQLISFLEDRFDVEVPDEDVSFENFDAVAAIVALVDRLLADRDRPAPDEVTAR